MKRRQWLDWVWLGVAATACGLLAFFLYEQTLTPVRAFGDPTLAAPGDTGPATDFEPPRAQAVHGLSATESFENIIARNLFSIDRTPPSVAETQTSAEPENRPELTAELTGVISVGTERRAIVYDPNADKSIVLQVGETLRSWRLQSLSSDEAVWARGARTVAQRLWQRPETSLYSTSTEKARTQVQTSEARASPGLSEPGGGENVRAQGGSAAIRTNAPDRRQGMGTGYIPID